MSKSETTLRKLRNKGRDVPEIHVFVCYECVSYKKGEEYVEIHDDIQILIIKGELIPIEATCPKCVGG